MDFTRAKKFTYTNADSNLLLLWVGVFVDAGQGKRERGDNQNDKITATNFEH